MFTPAPHSWRHRPGLRAGLAVTVACLMWRESCQQIREMKEKARMSDQLKNGLDELVFVSEQIAANRQTNMTDTQLRARLLSTSNGPGWERWCSTLTRDELLQAVAAAERTNRQRALFVPRNGTNLAPARRRKSQACESTAYGHDYRVQVLLSAVLLFLRKLTFWGKS